MINFIMFLNILSKVLYLSFLNCFQIYLHEENTLIFILKKIESWPILKLEYEKI